MKLCSNPRRRGPSSGRRDGGRRAGALGLATDRDAERRCRTSNTRSKPSDLKITDLRVAVIADAPMTCPIIRIDTNQGSPLRRGARRASKTYALMLKNA